MADNKTPQNSTLRSLPKASATYRPYSGKDAQTVK